MSLQQINVVAAVIVRNNKILATQRGYGEFEGWWEFPGGKVKHNETPKAALMREIQEELNTKIDVHSYLCTTEYDYPSFHLSMRCYVCSLIDNEFELLEHHAACWLDATHINDVQWLPADIQVVEAIQKASLI